MPQPNPPWTTTVDNLSDWQLTVRDRFTVRPTPIEPLATADFWLRDATLDFLNASAGIYDTLALELCHTPSGRRCGLTSQDFTFQPARQAATAAAAPVSRWNFRRGLLDRLPSRVLTLGQLYTSGNYASSGFAALTPVGAGHLLSAVAGTLMRLRGGYRASLIKDLSRANDATSRELARRGYHLLPVEPVMELPLSGMTGFDDYLGRLSSKYRVRYRRARGKLAGIYRKRLTGAEHPRLVSHLFALYRATSGGADFNLTPLTPQYLRWLLRVGVVHGYYTPEGELVGFTSAIANGVVYQAHYLGLREVHKLQHHLYHNLLYDLVGDALAGGYRTLDLGRTATEIKSSLGAAAVPYASLLKLRSPLLNRLVPAFTPTVFEAREWTPRNPFRDAI